MPSLLLLNPNTAPEVSARLLALAQARAPAGLAVRVATARFGARYIASEAAAAIAAHAALDLLAADLASHGAPSAVLLACFGDPGLFALRASCAQPLLGLAEASMRAAAALGPFVVVTGGPAWVPMLGRLALTLALPAPMLGVQAVARSGGELATDPAAPALLAEAAQQALARWPAARSVLLGGAGLAGLAEAVAPRLPLPVLDNVGVALAAAFDAALAAAASPTAEARQPATDGVPWSGLTPELMQFLSPAAGPGAGFP